MSIETKANSLVLWFADEEGRFIEGAPRSELARAIGPALRDLTAAAVRDEVALTLSLPNEAGATWHYDVSIRRLPRGSGARYAVAISDRKSEDAYLLSRFDLALQATHEAVWEWVVETGKVWWNDRAGEIFGYADGHPPSLQGWTDRIHPEDRNRVLVTYRDAIASGRAIWEETYRIIRTDGKVLDVFDRGVVDGDSSGKAVRLVGVMTDVTEARNAERARDEALQRLDQILRTLEDVIWLSDASTGEVLFLSPSFERVYGLPRAAMTKGSSFLDFVHPDDAKSLSDSLANAHEPPFDETYRMTRADGEVRWLHTRTVRVKGRGHTSDRVLGISSDVTNQRRLEQELLQARKLDGIGRLAGGVAHDFNNLLTVILSASEFALGTLPDEHPSNGDIKEVLNAASRASQLTNQLLSFARRRITQPVRIDLNELTEDMDKLLRRVIGETIELITRLAPDLDPVLADRGQIEQVLLNLAINARDAMPQGGRLTLETGNLRVDESYASAHADLKPGDHVMIAVSDTGPGIPRELQSQIFEPFFTTKSGGKGTGLGLSSCYGIVRQAGGVILVYSEMGKGTTFKILLPRNDTGATATEAPVPREIPSGKETILFVEDDEHVRRIGSRVLSQNGYQVLIACDGMEALRIAKERRGGIDLLLTDVVMPSMGGKELASVVADISPQTCVLFTSGYTDNAIVHNGVLDAGVDFLQKPYTPQNLLLRVRELLDSPKITRD